MSFYIKLFIGFILATCIGFTIKQGYDHIYQKGVDSMRPQLETAQRDLADYKLKYQKWVTETEEANRRFEKEQSDLQKDLQEQLRIAKEQAKQKEVIYRETIRYVPADVDNSTALPFGFVWLYTSTLQSKTYADATLGQFSDGPGGNAGTDTGIPLSSFAYIAGHNNMACVLLRKRVDLWEQWYRDSKTQFENARREQLDNVPGE